MTPFRAIMAITFLVPFALCLTTPHETMIPGFFADESVYFGMIQSLVHDRNLQWTRQDMERICQTHPAGPVGIILKQLPDNRIVYAKPLTYPLFAAIYFAVLGSKGIVIFNFMLVWLIVFMLAKHWGSTAGAALFSMGSLTLTAFSPYVFWTHPEIFTAFLLTGFYIGWTKTDHKSFSRAPHIMAVCLALAVTIKPPFLLFGIPPAIELIKNKRFKPFLTFFAVVAVIALLTVILTGNVNPYEGNRKIFTTRFPLDSSENLFAEGDSWSMQEARFYFDVNVFMANLFYFWTGRYSGLVWYFFPGIVTAFIALATRSNTRGKKLLACMFFLIIIQIVMIPTNYHGGGGALGNRYFVNVYPLLLFALPQLPSKRIQISTMLAAGFFSGPFLVYPWLSSYQPGEFTRHGFYSRLPAEWTLSGAYPIFHPDLYRVSFPGIKGYFYFLDRQSSGKIDQGFYIIQGRPTRIILELDSQQSDLDFLVTSDIYHGKGIFDAGAERTLFYAHPDSPGRFRMNLGAGKSKRDIYGRTRWVYQLRIQFQPLGDEYPSESHSYHDARIFLQPLSASM